MRLEVAQIRRTYHPLLAGSLALFAALTCLAVGLTNLEHFFIYAAVGAMFLATFSPLLIDASRGRLDYFELIHVFGILYFIRHGLSAIWVIKDPWWTMDPHLLPYIPKATVYALIGYLCLLCGYYLPWVGRDKPAVSHGVVPQGNLFLLAAGGVGLLGWISQAGLVRADSLNLRGLSGGATFLGNLSFLFVVGWTVAWLLVFSGRATRSQRLITFLLLAPASLIVARAHVGDKGHLLTMVGTPLLAYWYSRRKLPWTSMLILALITIFVVFPVYNTARNFDPAASSEEKLAMTFNTMSRWDADTYLLFSIYGFQSRMSDAPLFATVLRDVGRWVPYLDKTRLVLAPALVLIPRVVWPDKPRLELGREFADQFRMSAEMDTETSVAASIPGELYWYFDLPGILLGMALIGMGFRWLYRRYGDIRVDSPFDKGVYVMFLTLIVETEGSLVSQLAGILKIIVVLIIIRAVLVKLGALKLVPVTEDAGRVN